MSNGPPPNLPAQLWPRGCSKSLIAWVVLATAAYLVLDPGFGRARVPLAIIAGILAVLGPGSILSLILKRPETRGDAVARGQLREELKDGDAVVITGRVTSHAPLVSPLTGTPCVAYFYKLYREVFTTGKPYMEPVYWGLASQSFNVDTGTTTFRIDAVPQLSVPEAKLSGDDVIERARRFLQTTSPKIVGDNAGIFQTAAVAGAAFSLFREIMTHDSGDLHCDWKISRDYDLSSLRFEEEVLPVDADVAVSGHWSSAKNALVNRAADSSAAPLNVTLGSASALEGAAGSRFTMWTWALVWSALLGLLIWFGRDAAWFKKIVY